MKAKVSLFKILCSAFLCMMVFVGVFLCVPISTARADNFSNLKIGDSNFSMTINVHSRQNSTLPLQTTDVSTDAGTITYYVFRWKNLEDLQFRFQSTISSTTKNFTNFEFLVTHKASENLSDSLGTQEAETLYRGNIANNNFSQFDFYYYIDSTSSITESSTRSKGKDFGLYKFDFNYTYIEDGETYTISIGDFHVAVLPESVDSIANNDAQLLYTVTSSNRLMNVYNLYISNDAYKYVNPNNLQWNVIGKDKMNINYVLSKSIQEENLAEYANYRVLYENPTKPVGTNFIFDSNDIEGTWTVTLTIKGSQEKVLQVSGLSTIKVQQKSYVWLILLIVGIVMLIAIVITLIVFRKKRDKVW